MQWKIQLLGGLRAERNGQIVTRFRTQKTGALLAYLAYHAQKLHSREVLVEQFWPDLDAAAPRMSLSVALSSLRRELEPPDGPAGSVLLADRFTVQLNPAAIQVDATEFEAALGRAKCAEVVAERNRWLAAAVDQYAGELLTGYYEDWCLAERERLRIAYLRALGELMRSCRQTGDLDGALHHAWRAVAADPLQEPLQRELLSLLLAAGQPATALRQYRELERLLALELQRAPSPATARLYQEIERQSVAPGAPLSREPGRPAALGGWRLNETPSAASPLPHGTVTLLLAEAAPAPGDLGSAPPQELPTLLNEHGAVPLPSPGTASAAVFSGAGSAIDCALAALRASSHAGVEKSPPPRLALLTMEIYGAEAEYRQALERLSQLLAIAEPGQVLCGEQTAGLVGLMPSPRACFQPLRERQLPDDLSAGRVFEVQPVGAADLALTSPADVVPSRTTQFSLAARRAVLVPPAVPAADYST